MRERRLTKSVDKKVCGVCGGIGEYFGIDPTIIRVIYLILLMTTGIGILPYIIAAILMDDAPEGRTSDYNREENYYSANNYYESSEPVGFKPFADTSEIKGFSI
ncbi:PspC domain-containing protein [Butyrivibrio sp. VCD2006]|uniref:PspC domain-containing protein n=1 Tax=Butyrivibrio sp. VCD2006 TaxID=1280664 RepID=UPI0003F92AE2|nr:PspC domain-containing protein [Butyrivibrio sp. VCD2006]